MPTLFETIIGHVGNLFFVIGAFGLAKKNTYGFVAQFFGNALYATQAILMHNPPLIMLSIGLCAFNIYGIWEWARPIKTPENIAERRFADAVCDLYDDFIE